MPLIVYQRPIDDGIDSTDTALALPDGTQPLGHAAGVQWYRIPVGATAPAETREPTADELAIAKLELPAIVQLKASARRRIREEIGDIDDVVADQARQIEALTALSVRLAQVVLGGEVLNPAVATRYYDRITPVAQALDSGTLTLRGDMEGAAEMLARMLDRANRTNQIIGEHYLPKRDEVLG